MSIQHESIFNYKIYYLTQEQYDTLVVNGSITVDGQTINYDPNAEYRTPDTLVQDIADLKNSKGAANGLAPLDSNQKVPLQNLPTNETIAQTTESWLADNITQETGYVIDDSLTISGAAADAKATGDSINGLKSATTTGYIKIAGEYRGIYITASAGEIRTNTGYKAKVFNAVNGAEYRLHSTGNRLVYGLFDSLDTGTIAKDGMFVVDNDSPSAEHVIVNSVNASYLVVYVNNNIPVDSTADAIVYTETNAESQIKNIKKELFPEGEAFNWKAFASEKYPLGWCTGYYKASDGIGNASTNYLRNDNGYYTPADSVSAFTINAPTGWAVAVFEYGDDYSFIQMIGDMNSSNETATASVTITPTQGHRYRFSIGEKSAAETYLTDAFVKSIILKETYSKLDSIPSDRKSHLNILILGNSYSADSWGYVPFILLKYGITCNIHFYYRGSGSIDRLVAEWEDNTANGLDDFGQSHIRRFVQIDTRFRNKWTPNYADIHLSPKEVVLHGNGSDPNVDKWDLIVLNQGSRSQSFTKAPGNGDPRKGTEPYLRQIIDLIRLSYNNNFSLAWFGDYTSFDGYAGDTSKGYPAISAQDMDNRVGVLKSTQTIMEAEPFDFVIPSGTAIFNARTNTRLASTEISPNGNLWCSDKVHLQAGVPNYIANITVVESIFRKFYPHLSILGDDTRIDSNTISTLGCPFINNWAGAPMQSTDDELLYELAQKCAVNACNHPFDITPVYLPTDQTELEIFDTHSNRYWADALITQPSE